MEYYTSLNKQQHGLFLKCNTEQRNPHTKEYILYGPIYKMFKNIQQQNSIIKNCIFKLQSSKGVITKKVRGNVILWRLERLVIGRVLKRGF